MSTANLFFVVLGPDRLDADIAEYTGDEDKLAMPENEDANYRYDIHDKWERDADVSEDRILRDDEGVYIFNSRSSAITAAIAYLESSVIDPATHNISRLRQERKKYLPKVGKRRVVKATAN